MKKGHAMSQASSTLLAQLAYINNENATAELNRLHVKVVYRSAYGERLVYDSREHDSA
jgi:hypothetical protein